MTIFNEHTFLLIFEPADNTWVGKGMGELVQNFLGYVEISFQ